MSLTALNNNRYLLTLAISTFLIFFGFIFQSQAEETSPNSTSTTSFENDGQATTSSTSTINNVSTTTEQATSTSQEKRPPQTTDEHEMIDQKSDLSKIKQTRILNLAANISNRLEAVIERHEKIVMRLERRIEKIEQAGRNLDEVKIKLTEIKSDINKAKSNIHSIDFEVYEVISSDNPKQNWPKVRTTYQETEQSILKNQEKLLEVVSILKHEPKEEIENTGSENNSIPQ